MQLPYKTPSRERERDGSRWLNAGEQGSAGFAEGCEVKESVGWLPLGSLKKGELGRKWSCVTAGFWQQVECWVER